MTLIWVFHHLGQLPSRFCQIPISKNNQNSTQANGTPCMCTSFKATRSNSPLRRHVLHKSDDFVNSNSSFRVLVHQVERDVAQLFRKIERQAGNRYILCYKTFYFYPLPLPGVFRVFSRSAGDARPSVKSPAANFKPLSKSVQN